MGKLIATNVDVYLGKRIKLRRKELDVSAEQLAESLGFSQQQLSRYERGKNRISTKLLIDVAKLLDTPAEWFLLDCPTKQTPLVENTGVTHYSPDEGLKKRLDQQWSSLSLEKQQALVKFLDVIR